MRSSHLCACGCGKRTAISADTGLPNRFLHGHHRRTHPISRKRQKPMNGICACGCGEPIPPNRIHKYRPSYYLPGHSTRKSPGRNTYTPQPEEIPSGQCECGCGKKTRKAKLTARSKRHFAGHPVPFIHGHRPKVPHEKHHLWLGGRFVHLSGYVYVHAPEHPNRNAAGYILEHRLVMERVIGRYLKTHERVHHIDSVKTNNRPENLELSNGNHGPGSCLKCADCGSLNVVPTGLIPGAPRWIRHKAYMPRGQ